MRRLVFLAVAVALAACGQQQQSGSNEATTPASPSYQDEAAEGGAAPEIQEVDAALLAAPNDGFSAIEPSEVGVFGAPTIREALEPLFGPEMTEGATVHLTVRENGDTAVADIVRSGLADDSVSAGHVRIEFRREPDGWFPVNAYRRTQCARGAEAGQWTTGACP